MLDLQRWDLSLETVVEDYDLHVQLHLCVCVCVFCVCLFGGHASEATFMHGSGDKHVDISKSWYMQVHVHLLYSVLVAAPLACEH